ncbi:MAG TPA: glutaredoxin family protein [Burkholderiaceae bacterium]|jgi:glutaredoxin|nr:glutaredoxin family protein [Burkholderiaceae bacterium]
MRSRTVLIALSLAPAFACAQYKWIDADGRVAYGDNPPRDARNVQRVDARGASGEADALAALPFELRRTARDFPVTLYTTRDCAPCEAARALLAARGIPYAERTVTTPHDLEALEKLGHGKRLPVLTVGRQVQREFEAGAWNALLDAAGYPRASQLPRTWQQPAPQPLAPRSEPAAAGETAAQAN